MNAFTTPAKVDWVKKLQRAENSKIGGQKRAQQLGSRPVINDTPKKRDKHEKD